MDVGRLPAHAAGSDSPAPQSLAARAILIPRLGRRAA
jgi:hypothetical protein